MPEEAEYAGHAAQRDCHRPGRLVLPVAEMPAAIAAYVERRAPQGRRRSRSVAHSVPTTASSREMLTLLRVRTGHDFSNYKHADDAAPHRAPHAACAACPTIAAYARLIRAAARRSGGAAEGAADQRHQLLPRRRGVRRRSSAGSSRGCSLDKGAQRPGARVGAGLRDGRRSVFDGDAAGRARGGDGRRAADPDLRDRPRRAGDRSRRAKGVYTEAERRRRVRGTAAAVLRTRRRRLPRPAASCARWCCSRTTT